MPERLRLSIDHLLEGVQIIDRDWRYVYANRTAAEHGRQAVDRLIGETMMARYPGIEKTPVFGVMRRVMEDRRPESLRNAFTYPDGEQRWFDLLIEPVPAGICVLSLDVTEQKLAEDRLRLAEARTAFALTTAGVCVWQLDLASGAMEWSETLRHVLGVERAPATLDEFLPHVEPQDREAVRTAVTRPRDAASKDLFVPFRLVRPDGQPRWMEGHAYVTPDAPGRLVGVAIDVTERRNAEIQFQQAQKMEAVGRLAGSIAHDFNNQLTAILGFTEMILDQPLDEPIRRDMAEVKGAAERSAALTRQLLAFSRRQVLPIAPLDVNGVIEGMTRLCERLLGENIACVRRLAATHPILGDVGQLENVLTNLAVNARDAMPEGGRLTLGTDTVDLTDDDARQHPSMTAGRYTVITVADTGHGMDAATQARIFEPFFTTKDAGKGTGLGLATAYGVVRQMGGFIWVCSEPGRGTTFRLYFPATGQAQAPAAKRAARPPSRRPGATILVVEDDGGVRELSVRTLQRAGYRVRAAASAREARRTLRDTGASVDLFVVDVALPGQTGPALVEELALGPHQVLFMSGYADTPGLNGPTRAYRLIEKPFTGQMLLESVRGLLATGGRRRAARRRGRAGSRPRRRGAAGRVRSTA